MFSFKFTLHAILPILSAAPLTLIITVSSVAIGLIVGFLLALTRLYRIPVLNQLTQLFVSFVRGVPMIVMLYMVYFIMPILFIWLNDNAGFHINLRNTPTLTYAIVTFSVYTSAYFTEMYRSALGSVDAKQMEAAFSVGLTRAQGMWRIVLPQALVVAIPNIENSFLGILKGSSLAVYVGVLEIMNRAKLEAADGFRYIEVYTIAAVIYWIISVIIERLFSSVELKLQFEKKSWA